MTPDGLPLFMGAEFGAHGRGAIEAVAIWPESTNEELEDMPQNIVTEEFVTIDSLRLPRLPSLAEELRDHQQNQ